MAIINGILDVISIHAPREGGDAHGKARKQPCAISIHAPREGGDGLSDRCGLLSQHFNPRPPRGGRQQVQHFSLRLTIISIHAPREGGDDLHLFDGAEHGNFNPRPPRGGRPFAEMLSPLSVSTFQSTPPARGATTGIVSMVPSEENFNPRPPRGGRRWLLPNYPQLRNFNPRPPRGGRPLRRPQGRVHVHFNPRPPRGGRLGGKSRPCMT